MSNLGQAVSSIAGAAIGFVLGGPTGAVYGFQAGLLGGSALFPTQLPGVQGPRLEDFERLSSDPGAPRWQVFGRAPVPGFRMYLGPVTEISTTEEVGGKGPPEQEVTTFRYFQTLALGLCDAPTGGIGGVGRIWENGELVYDPRPQQDGESADDYVSRQAMSEAYEETFTLYPGDEEQLADPTLELEQGAGNVPPFRGHAYMVFPDRELKADQGSRHPAFKVEIFGHADVAGCNLEIEKEADVEPWSEATGSSLLRSAEAVSNKIVEQDGVSNGDGTWTRFIRTIDFQGNEIATGESVIATLDDHVDVTIANVQNASLIQAMRKNGAGTAAGISAWFVNGALGERPIAPPVGANHYYTFAGDVPQTSRTLYVPDVGVYLIGGDPATPETWVARYPVLGVGPLSEPDAYRVIQDVTPIDAVVGLAGVDDERRIYVYRKGDASGSGTAYDLLRLSSDLGSVIDEIAMPADVIDDDSIRVVCGKYVTANFSEGPVVAPSFTVDRSQDLNIGAAITSANLGIGASADGWFDGHIAGVDTDMIAQWWVGDPPVQDFQHEMALLSQLISGNVVDSDAQVWSNHNPANNLWRNLGSSGFVLEAWRSSSEAAGTTVVLCSYAIRDVATQTVQGAGTIRFESTTFDGAP